ncbi:polysaccharide biosynthesis tyrosine autokinase [Qipengyuania sp. JC766]|uniref:GumC family protein n=1 Tax=Qipengyuania sp. JC766 TaxID=3232139 RepID=UPI003457AF08
MPFRAGQLTTGNGAAADAPGHAAGGGFSSLSLPVLLVTIRRQKWTIAALAVLGLLAGLLITALTTPVYEATARIEVNPEAQALAEVDSQSPQGASIDGTYLQTQEELLRTRTLRERVARELRLDAARGGDEAGAPRQRLEMAVTELERAVTINNLPDTRLFEIVVESADPEQAAQVANAYASEFIELNIEWQLETDAYARDVLAKQIAETRSNLEDSERALVTYARNREIITLASPDQSGEGESLATRSLAEVNGALIEARARRIAAQEQLRFATNNTPSTNAGSAALTTQLAQLRAEYQQKRDLFKPDYPEMQALQQQIASLESSLQNIRNQDRSQSRDALQSAYNAALGEERQLEAQLDSLTSSALTERGESIQYNILKRDVDTNAARYDALLERFKEIGAAGTEVQNLINVVDPAAVPRSPVRPNMVINLLLGLIAGLAIGIVVAVLSGLLSTKIRGQRDVEQLLQQKFIGGIPFGEDGESVAIALNDPKTPIYESFVSVANRLRFSTSQGFPKLLSLTSTVPNEGKSSTAYGIAHILARQGRRVLLIDADLRMPTFLGFERGEGVDAVQDQVSSNQGRGLTDVLVGEAQPSEAIVSINDRLHLLPSGQVPPNPAELLSSDRFANLLSEELESYDNIIVDAPPVLGLADAPIVASVVGATLFVVQFNRATSSGVRSAIQRIQDNNGSIIGVVLAQTKPEETDEAYGYGYSYAYSYGQGSSEPRGLAKVFGSLKR